MTVPLVWNHQRTTRPPAAYVFLKMVLNVVRLGLGTSLAKLTHATFRPLAKLHSVSLLELPLELAVLLDPLVDDVPTDDDAWLDDVPLADDVPEPVPFELELELDAFEFEFEFEFDEPLLLPLRDEAFELEPVREPVAADDSLVFDAEPSSPGLAV